MSKKIQLSVPKPCHEDWDAMTPVEKGKFCGSCQKQVVDFSNMSDRQVAEFFKKPSTGSVCGRFMTDQLDRDFEIPKKRIPWFKYFFQFALPAFLVSLKASAQTKGKVSVTTVASDTTLRPTMGIVAWERPKGEVEVIKLSGILQLKVVDDKGNPIPYASIETGVIGKGGVTNKAGLFNLDKSILNISGKIYVSSGGYERKEIAVKTFSHLNGTFTVVLQDKGWLENVVVTAVCQKRNEMTLGEVVIMDRPKQGLKNVPLIPTTKDPINSFFKVFPNPAEAGTNLNIELKQTEEGYYSLQLLSESGQAVHQQEIWIDADAKLLNIEIPELAAGNYLLSLTNKKTKKSFTEKLIIQ